MYKFLTKLVLTGGPCAGKTKALARIYYELTEKGYIVYLVPEAATLVLNSGLQISERGINNFLFESLVLSMQSNNERIFEAAANFNDNRDVIIVCDRGIVDGKAYVSEDEFKTLCKELGQDEIIIRDSYDAVFHLKTAADGAESFYTNETNKMRRENLVEAREKDLKTLLAWVGHSHLRVIDNSTNFEMKIDRLMAEIYSFLGLPIPIEIERKFLIDMPDIENMKKCVFMTEVDILQTYLRCATKGEERRIRQRGINGSYSYFSTTKRKVNEISRIELEEKIDKDKYIELLMQTDLNSKPIRKTRYCFVYNNQYFELDIYPSWKDKAIIEIELTDKNQLIDIPNFISVIKEVTNDDKYKNRYLARE